MFLPSLGHPQNAKKVPTGVSLDSKAANLRLQKEMSQVIDTYKAADNGPDDLNPAPGWVRLRSLQGRVQTEFSFSTETRTFPTRDREGYFNHKTLEVTTAEYRRVDFGSDGKPDREVLMGYQDTLEGNLISKSVVDQEGSSYTLGGKGRTYRSNFKAGDTINTRAWM